MTAPDRSRSVIPLAIAGAITILAAAIIVIEEPGWSTPPLSSLHALLTQNAVATSTSFSTQDRAFLVAAHQNDVSEVADGTTAQSRGNSPEVRALGAQLVKDHNPLERSIKQVAVVHDVALPPSPTQAQLDRSAKVTTNTGRAFDNAWLKAQITGHTQTLAAIDNEIKTGSSPDVVQAARDARVVVQRHLNMLNHPFPEPKPKPSASPKPKPTTSTKTSRSPSSVEAGTGGQAALTTHHDVAAGLLGGVGAGLIAAAGVITRRRRRGGLFGS